MFSTFINCGVKRKDANALSRVAPDNGRRLEHLESISSPSSYNPFQPGHQLHYFQFDFDPFLPQTIFMPNPSINNARFAGSDPAACGCGSGYVSR